MSTYKETDAYPEINAIFRKYKISSYICARFETLVEALSDSNQGFFAHHFLRAIRDGVSDWVIYKEEDKKEYDITVEIFDLLEGVIITSEEKICDESSHMFAEWQLFNIFSNSKEP